MAKAHHRVAAAKHRNARKETARPPRARKGRGQKGATKGGFFGTFNRGFARTTHAYEGIVARILGKHPSLTVFQVKTILHALSANVR